MRREPALSPTTVRTDSGVAQLESEFLRVAIPIADGGLRTVDLVIKRDPRDGLTFRGILASGNRSFEEAGELLERFERTWRVVEHAGRVFGFSAKGIVAISEFSDKYPSMQEAEIGTIRWLIKNPETTDPKGVMVFRWVEFPRMPFGFFDDPTTSQPKKRFFVMSSARMTTG
ncbi:MAG TPA: hypothetical protein VH087_14720 [Thermoanaerobaculia bacterium]|nr:hypothetical protein [Thermoanaerobaculia bacterium]